MLYIIQYPVSDRQLPIWRCFELLRHRGGLRSCSECIAGFLKKNLHITQFLRRKLKAQVGHKIHNTNKLEQYVGQLVLLPIGCMDACWVLVMKRRPNTTKLTEFFLYFVGNWLQSENILVDLWNVKKNKTSEQQTCRGLEQGTQRFGGQTPCNIHLLKVEAEFKPMKHRLEENKIRLQEEKNRLGESRQK